MIHIEDTTPALSSMNLKFTFRTQLLWCHRFSHVNSWVFPSLKKYSNRSKSENSWVTMKASVKNQNALGHTMAIHYYYVFWCNDNRKDNNVFQFSSKKLNRNFCCLFILWHITTDIIAGKKLKILKLAQNAVLSANSTNSITISNDKKYLVQ